MLDIDTWGLTPGSDIRSIGAVVFDPMMGWIGGYNDGYMDNIGCFYIACDNPVSYMDNESGVHVRKYPLNRDPNTVRWWSEQSPEAQAAFANPVDLKDALAQFHAWYARYAVDNGHEIRIWANDPHFDVVLLEAVYRAVKLPVPWHYRAPRSMRTVMEIAGMSREDCENYGDAHNALHDAIAQAMTVCKAYRWISK